MTYYVSNGTLSSTLTHRGTENLGWTRDQNDPKFRDTSVVGIVALFVKPLQLPRDVSSLINFTRGAKTFLFK